MHCFGILYFNKPDLTKKCLNSLLDSLKSVSTHNKTSIILLDNGSTASATSEVASFCENKNTKIEILPIKTNQGFAAGMNSLLKYGFNNLNASWVTLISNDTLFPENFASTLIQSSQEHTSPTILCGTVYYYHSQHIVSYTHGELDATHELKHHKHRIEQIVFPQYYPAAVTTWNRAAFEKLAGFNTDFFCYWEDVELSFRATKEGVRLISLPNTSLFHLGRGTTKGKKAYYSHFLVGQKKFLEILNKSH